jgi:hypothetical protein
VTRLLLYINRRSGVAHVDRDCDAIASVPARYLRVEAYDGSRPRRLCSRCWNGGCPRRSAFAGAAESVTERSEGNPRSGLTGSDGAVTPATERAVVGGERRSDGAHVQVEVNFCPLAEPCDLAWLPVGLPRTRGDALELVSRCRGSLFRIVAS